MTLLDSTILTSELAEVVRGKLQAAPTPLKLAEVVKGLPKPRKTKVADFQNEVRPILDEQVRFGQVFCCSSGKNGETRYWSRDEKHLLREKAIDVGAIPQSLSAFKKALAKEVKGADGAFLESVIRELIGEDKLFEHPPKTARGGSLFGATPPPPPAPTLEQPKHVKALNKLVDACRKLVAAANVSVEELLQTVHRHLRESPVDPKAPSAVAAATTDKEPMPPPSLVGASPAELEDVLLKALDHAPVLSLAELRASMPAEYRGPAFDDAVLKLADEQQVIVSQDADPTRFSDVEKAEYVRDGEALFTTIAKRS